MSVENAVQSQVSEAPVVETQAAPEPIQSTETQFEPGVDTTSGAVAPDLEAATPAAPEPGTISLNDQGELIIADDVLESHFSELAAQPQSTQHLDALGVETQTLPVQQQQQPAEQVQYYSPEDMAKAFIDNQIDAAKMPEALRQYHDAINAELARRQEIQALAQPPAQPLQRVPPPGPPPQKPTDFTLKIDREQYKQLRDGGKNLAAKYLGIKPEAIDEYDQAHQEAIQVAMQEIKTKANEIHRQQIEQNYAQQVQQYQQHVQAFQQQYVQQRQQQYQGLIKEFQQNPNWKEIDGKFYPEWFGKQDARTRQAIEQVMSSGDIAKVKQVMKSVFAAYEQVKGRNQPQPGPAKRAKVVPQFMSSGNEADVGQKRGLGDVSNLESMSPDQRGDWFAKNFL